MELLLLKYSKSHWNILDFETHMQNPNKYENKFECKFKFLKVIFKILVMLGAIPVECSGKRSVITWRWKLTG